MDEKKCKNCDFWDYTTDQGGFCRRNAPIPVPMSEKSGPFTLVWPSTSKDDWCADGRMNGKWFYENE